MSIRLETVAKCPHCPHKSFTTLAALGNHMKYKHSEKTSQLKTSR